MADRTRARTRGEPAAPADRSGRDQELNHAQGALVEGSVRLVTFTGPAGVGKTWAARELKRRLVTTGGWRAATVRVDRARGFTELLQATADALRMPVPGGGLPARLGQVLAAEPYVLVFDGCERLLGHPHPVAQFLDLFPSLRVAATSLRPLGVPGERVVGLDPLDVPPATAGVDELSQSRAVRLFVRRASEVDRGFEPRDGDLAAIGELCRRVHGLPLGIEIMATRVGSQSPSAMVDDLDSGLELAFRHTSNGEEPRHLSLRSALGWSYTMLDPDAARLLRRMAVFGGPATVGMLAVVVPDVTPEPAVTGALDRLVNHRLVNPHPAPGAPAFVLVDLLREFAAEQLLEEGELAWAEEAHTRAVLEFALARSDAVDAAEDDIAQAELTRCETDLRSVLRRLMGNADVERGLLMATALAPFVLRRGYDGFVRPALSSLLRRAGAADDGLVARAELWQARLSAHFDGPAAADDVRAALADALARARRSGDSATVLLGLAFVMQTLPVTRDLAGASTAAAEGLPLAVASGDERWMARFHAWSGMVANQAGRVEESLELARRGVELVEERPDPRAQILLALLLAGLPPDRAAPLMLRLPPVDVLLDLARRLEDARYEPFLLRTAAGLAVARGDLPTAAARCGECLRLAHRQAAWHDLPFAVVLLALVAMGRRDFAAAARFHGMGRGHIEVLRPGSPPHWVDEYLAKVEQVRRALGDEAFEAEARQGEDDMHAAALGEALSYADRVADGSSHAAVDGRPRVPTPRQGEPDHLTPRELEVLVELITGATNKEISRRLGMTPKTVMHHSTAIYRKLGVRGRAEATAWAFRHGLAD